MKKIKDRFLAKIRNSAWWNSRIARRIIPRTDYTKNVITLSGGSVIAQAINMLTIPLFARIYSPSDFGLLALFSSFSFLFQSIISGRYELAILLPKKNKEAANLVYISFLYTVLMLTILLIIWFVFREKITMLLTNNIVSIKVFIFTNVAISGIYNSLYYWSNRLKKYRVMSIALIGEVLITSLSRLLLYFYNYNSINLIVSLILGKGFSLSYLLFQNITIFSNYKIEISLIKKLLKKYIKFPTISTLSALVNSFYNEINSLAMPLLFTLDSLGYYSNAKKMLSLPITIVAASIGKVYFSKASNAMQNQGNIKNIYNKTLKKLAELSILIFLPIFFLVKPLTSFVLGLEWEQTGQYAQLLTFIFMLRFITTVLSYTLYVFNKISNIFFFDLISLLINVLLIFTALKLNLSAVNYVSLFSIVQGVIYLLFIIYLTRLVNKSEA